MQSEMIKLKMLENLVRVQDRAEKRINVLDYAYMNEDAHSYFLQQILQYERQGHQVFLKSFLKRILDEENIEDEKFDVAAQVQILDGRRRLDLRLESTNLLVVIENKVKLAQDGDRQMDDYWRYVNDMKKDGGRLVYLTLAGGAPAVWSLAEREREEVIKSGRYFEKNYRTDILDWLKEDVLPNCLISEAFLAQSVRLYIDSLRRLSGDYPQQDLASRLFEVLKSYGIETYSKVTEAVNQLTSMYDELGPDDEHRMLMHESRELMSVVQNWLVYECIYESSWHTAYNLKWLLKNNPTVAYKSRGRFNVEPFTSIGQFTYEGGNYVQLATKDYIRIHICCSPAGILDGPYVFVDSFSFFNGEGLERVGFVKCENTYRYPMQNFEKDKTGLDEVARHIETMIGLLRNHVPALRL